MSAPTKRKTTIRKTTPKPTPNTEAGDVVEVQPVTHLTYTVIDDVLHYTTKAGDELAIDLDFPADLLKMAMGRDDENRTEEEQFEIVARTFGENFADAYPKMGAIERRRLQRAIFTEFQKAMLMPLGESQRSSGS